MTRIIILAAGLGKRMGGKMPKVLISLAGKPMLKYLVEAVKKSGVDKRPVVVVAPDNKELVKRSLEGYDCDYIVQEEQLGTGHAVLCTRDFLENEADNILIFYGDMPLVSAETIKKINNTHIDEGKVLTMATVKVSDFKDWRKGFYDFGRILRNDKGKVVQIIEKKDATEEQLNIKEVNPSYFCFKAEWIWKNLDKLENKNVQKEYYLTDLIGIACRQGQDIATVEIEPKEALGVNTPQQLEDLKKIILN